MIRGQSWGLLILVFFLVARRQDRFIRRYSVNLMWCDQFAVYGPDLIEVKSDTPIPDDTPATGTAAQARFSAGCRFSRTAARQGSRKVDRRLSCFAVCRSQLAELKGVPRFTLLRRASISSWVCGSSTIDSQLSGMATGQLSGLSSHRGGSVRSRLARLPHDQFIARFTILARSALRFTYRHTFRGVHPARSGSS